MIQFSAGVNLYPELAGNRAFATIHYFFHIHQDDGRSEFLHLGKTLDFNIAQNNFNYQKIIIVSIRNLDFSTIIN